MSPLAMICATTSVVLGATYMIAAGAPERYVIVNALALVVGCIAAALLRRTVVRASNIADAMTMAVGVALLATATFGVHLDGVSRWIAVGGISLQPSLILLPVSVVQFARHRSWVSTFGLVLAGIGLAVQPDRAMAGTLVAGMAALWAYRQETPVTIVFVVAAIGFAMTMRSADVVAPVAFVEQVVPSAFAFHWLTGLAVVGGLTLTLVPPVVAVRRHSQMGSVPVVFGLTWAVIIAFSLVGNYPTPLVGYGSSAILGYCLSAALARESVVKITAGMKLAV